MISACTINVIPKFSIYQESNCNQYQTQLRANVTTDIHSLSNVSIYENNISIVTNIAIGIMYISYETKDWVGQLRSQSKYLCIAISTKSNHTIDIRTSNEYTNVCECYTIMFKHTTCSSKPKIMFSPIKRLTKV